MSLATKLEAEIEGQLIRFELDGEPGRVVRVFERPLVRSQYEDFGPTLTHEKLTELHGLELSVETLRHWMIGDGLWIPRARREPRIQQPRRRRPCRGELI